MGPKRASEGDLEQSSKIPKIEHGISASPLSQQRLPNNDFSGSVKKKLANSTRTGQACDRCKIRKIRCDPRPEGCSPCVQNRTPCKTTDRITGRATTRGHAEALETENAYLRAQVAELQGQLKEMGVEPRTVSGYNSFPPSGVPWSSSLGNDGQGWVDPSQRRMSTPPLPGYSHSIGAPNGLDNTEYRPLPQFKTNSIGDNYLGVSSADSLLSHIKGTSLSVFGTEIDITDFVQNEEDYDKSVMSYSHFLNVALNSDQQVEHAPFPEYTILNEYSNWYLRSLNPYTALLDKPAFTQLIRRIGNDPNFTPSAAETVCVHMMLAIIKYQISVRNHEESYSLMEESHKHYRYSLSFFQDLLHGHTLQDLQALTLICVHLRNFPKPGAAWIMCSTTFLLAVELGLHRSTKAWADTTQKMERGEVEMRKRIFWTLHALNTNLSGKLGRPMPINMEDVDVEFPEPVSDCSREEDAELSPFHKCSFQVGIQTAKYTVWSSELYRTIYAVRQPPRSYEDTVRRLENGIRQWREEMPYELAEPARAKQEDYIFALFLEFWDLEFQLLLHHPAVCRSTDPEFINANLDKCVAASSKMLHNCNEMRKLKSLDIPWINSVVYIAAIFTTLFVYFQRRDRMTSVDMTKLRNDMNQWIDVMGECGKLLGTGDKLKNAIQKIVVHSLNSINEHIVKKTATEAVARAALGQGPQDPTPPTSVYGNGNNFHEQYPDPSGPPTDPALTASGAPYSGVPTGAPFYNNSNSASVPSYQPPTNAFEQQSYGGSDDTGMNPSHVAALASAASGAPPQRPNETFMYASTTGANNGRQPPYPANGVSPNDWQQWTRTFMHQPGPSGEYINTANTLMALGGREGGAQGPGQPSSGAVEGSAMQVPGPSNFQWPGIVFGAGPNGHVNQQ